MTVTLTRPQAPAATMYNDLYVRDNFGDSGLYPSTGNPYQSPDVIPCQSGSLTWSTANSTYNGPDQGKAVISPGVNNIYVRAKNLNNVAGSGTVGLYYSSASLFLLPQKWTQITSAGGVAALPFVDASGNPSIAAGGIGLSNPSFLLTGLTPGPHYCFITVIQTPAHPVTIPSGFLSNADFTQWIQNNPAVGWRNISYVPNSATQMIRTFNFGSINPASAYFHFRILGRGFAANTAINSQCTDQACPINANTPLPAPDVNGNQITGFDAIVPANFNGNLVMTATSPGGSFPVGATLTMTYYQYPNMAEELDLAVAGLFTIAKGTEKEPIEYAATLIQLGECTVTVTRNPAQFE